MSGRGQFVLRIVCWAGGRPSPRDGQYVIAFDPAGPTMASGHGLRTARRFATPLEAHAFWRQSVGRRPDGQPDRPMAAWTVAVESAYDEDELEGL